MEKAVIYARYSSASQTEQSIEGQVHVCRDYAEKNGYSIIKIYADRATTGTNDKRPEFQRMIKESAKGLYSTVIVYQLDRFARNRYDSAIYKNTLKKNGVRVISANEPIANDPSGIILESMLEGMAEYYSAELSQKVKRGLNESRLKGFATSPFAPFGYKVVNRKYTIDPVNSVYVKTIFEMYSSGKTVKEIQTWLKSTANKYYHKNSILNILSNKKYIGVYISTDGKTYPNLIPAIVDKDIFKKVEKRLEKNKTRAASFKAAERFILSGKTFCGTCKNQMHGVSGTSRNSSKHYYYKCCHFDEDCLSIKKRKLEDIVINSTIEYILNPKTIKKIAHQVVVYSNEELPSKIEDFKRQLKDIQRSLDNLVKAIENGIYNNSTNERMLELESQKAELEKAISFEQLNKPISLREDEIEYWMNSFKGGDVNDNDYKERLVDTFINKVIVYKDKIVIVYNIHDGKDLKKTVKDIEKDIEKADVFEYDTLISTKMTQVIFFVAPPYSKQSEV